ncbi:AMP-binding protein [Chungangia koreensis]|uniref:AMP-binding protein n=1 Tax=Chungangia koreensis TaxID=752657 RepID=A0ABV8X746_9LACT
MLTELNWIIKRAAMSPTHTALVNVHSDEHWTYKKLIGRISFWRNVFTTEGLSKGDRIAVLSPNHPELFAILFACGLDGYIYVPLNWRFSVHELQYVIGDCQPSYIVFDELMEDVANQLSVSTSRSLSNSDATVQEVFQSSVELKPEDPWLLIYTGGTTGNPKGVILSFEAVNCNSINTIISWGLTEEDTTINYMPLFHTGGINALSLPILMAGGTVVIGNRFDADMALRATDRYEATISLFVPTMYQQMIQENYFKQSSFPSMKVFLSGGAPCPQTIYNRFTERGFKFKEGYGLTEAGPNNFFIRPELAETKKGSVGKSMIFNSVKVVDEEGNPCGPGEVGELYLSGKHIFTAYWNKPLETSAAFDDGWLKTGDLAKFDEDGDYYIVGRKKEMIISGGENIYPQEVEQCLIHFLGIREAAVVGIPDEKWGESVTAFIVLDDGIEYEEEALLIHCRKYLGSYKVPKKIVILSELPKTHVGKIDKKKLQAFEPSR